MYEKYININASLPFYENNNPQDFNVSRMWPEMREEGTGTQGYGGEIGNVYLKVWFCIVDFQRISNNL
jgi:hypothetical protein